MRLTRTRTITQASFLILFLWLLSRADFSRIANYPVSLFLEMDPLHSLATSLSSWTLYSGLILSLLVIIPTLFLGRVFCGWVCPFGALHEAVSWLFLPKKRAELLEANRYRPIFAVKYYILAGFLVLTAFGITQVGLLDPIALLTRSLATSVYPAIGWLTGGLVLPVRQFQEGWLLGGILLGLLLLNAVIPRFFCRVLCPLGALLGILSRWSVFQVYRPETRCSGCEQCLVNCQGAAEPHLKLRKSECFVCLDCREDCPTQEVSFAFVPPADQSVASPDLSRRRLLQTGALTAVSVPLLGASVRPDRLPDPRVIRPPGSVPEDDFLAKCIKCGACMKVCPTNTVQPALFEAGLEGIWTPLMHYRIGFCEYTCTLCSEVCPTGAIRRISREEKLGEPPFESRVRLGTAFVNRHRCLPWAMNTPCIVCEEVCPVSPKAIYLEPAEVVNSVGRRIRLQRPVVDPNRCIGCGLCEYKCPVYDQRAIHVTSVGESRSSSNVMVLDPDSTV